MRKIAFLFINIIAIFEIYSVSAASLGNSIEEAFLRNFPESSWSNSEGIPRIIYGKDGLALLPVKSLMPDETKFLVSLFSDPDEVKALGHGKARAEEEMHALIKRFSDRWEVRELANAFLIKKCEKSIGLCALKTTAAPGTVEVFTILSSTVRSQGIGKSLTGLLVEYLLFLTEVGYSINGTPLNFIVATADPDNLMSQALMKRLGFRPVSNEDELKVLYGSIKDLEMEFQETDDSIPRPFKKMCIIYPPLYDKRAKAVFVLDLFKTIFAAKL